MAEDNLIALLALLVLVGACAGFLSGLFGVGGGAIIVPMLYYNYTSLGVALDNALHIAIGSSLATIVLTQSASAYGHYRRGCFDFALWRLWALPLILGTIMGGAVAGVVSGRALLYLFSFGIFIIALIMIYRNIKDGESQPKPIFRKDSLFLYPLSFLSGLFSALIGIGGGSFNVSAMHLLFGVKIRQAIGTSSALGVLIGFFGMCAFMISGWGLTDELPFSLGYVNIPTLLLMIPFTILLTPLGVWVAYHLSPKYLRFAFALLLTGVSVHMFFEAFLA